MVMRDFDYDRAHELVRLPDGRHSCNLCKLSWVRRPRTFCAGVPVFRFGCWPEGYYTYTQLRRMKRRPLDREQPDGAYFLRKSPYRRWLYHVDRTLAARVLTPRQVEAIEKMRAVLAARYTCERCGYYDKSHGKNKYAERFDRGWCGRCWEFYHRQRRRIEQCAWARRYVESGPFVILDSETTGLDFKLDETIELAIVDGHSGAVLFNSLIQPENLEKRYWLATHIHGIDRDDLSGAPRFLEVWPVVSAILRRYRRVVVYNATFDYLMLKSTARRYDCGVPGGPGGRQWECLMEQYARYHGYWSAYHGNYSWCKLDFACQEMGVVSQGPAHRALSDALRARALLWAMVERDGKIDLMEALPPVYVAPAFDGDLNLLGELDAHPF